MFERIDNLIDKLDDYGMRNFIHQLCFMLANLEPEILLQLLDTNEFLASHPVYLSELERIIKESDNPEEEFEMLINRLQFEYNNY
mgnify:CR=1 FL=1